MAISPTTASRCWKKGVLEEGWGACWWVDREVMMFGEQSDVFSAGAIAGV